MSYTRRDIGRLALSGLPAGFHLAGASSESGPRAVHPAARPGGVQVGLQVPDSFAPEPPSSDAWLANCVGLGVRAIELSAPAVEALLGVPVPPACAMPMPADGLALGLHPLEEEVLQDEVDLARATFARQLERWRGAVSMAPLETLRRRHEDAGVRIDIVSWSGLALLSDDEVEYCFRFAKALGARALSTDLMVGGPRRLGRFADRHQLLLGFHGRPGDDAGELEAAFSHGRFIGATLDLDAWLADRHPPPLAFLSQHAGRIVNVLLTDRPADNAVPFGAGAGAVRDMLAAMRTTELPLQATVRVEPGGPAGPRRTGRIATALEYCRACLTA